jgi:hypothetical protein
LYEQLGDRLSLTPARGAVLYHDSLSSPNLLESPPGCFILSGRCTFRAASESSPEGGIAKVGPEGVWINMT